MRGIIRFIKNNKKMFVELGGSVVLVYFVLAYVFALGVARGNFIPLPFWHAPWWWIW